MGFLCGSVTSIKEIPQADEFHHDVWWRERRERVFVSLNASPKSFVHKALKDEQIECIHRIVCHGRDVLAVLPTAIRQERYISINFKRAVQPTPRQLPVFCWLTKWNGTVTKFCFWNLLISKETGGRVLQNKPYFCRPYCTALHVNSRSSCIV